MLGPSPLLLSRFFFQSTSPAGIYTLSLHDALPISLAPWLDTITRVLGVVVILMGLAFIGKVPFLQRERSEEHTSELQSRGHLVCRLLLEKKKTIHHGDRQGTKRHND